MKNYKNVIYILTNPLYAGYIKIGYASDLQQRLSSLNTGMLRNFEAYAVYETNVKNADKSFHAIIDDLAPIVRARVINGQRVQDKEFFKLEPEQAYDLLKHIAVMTGTENRLHKHGESDSVMPPASPYVQQAGDDKGKRRTVMNCTEKPVLCRIGSETHPFQTWVDALVWQCDEIIRKVGFAAFKSTALPLKTSKKQSKRKLFAETEEEMRGFSFHKFPEGDLYMLTNYSAASIQKISAELNKLWPEMAMTFEYER